MRSLERVNIRTNVRTYVRTYVLTYIRTGQTLYPLHNFVVRGDNKTHTKKKHKRAACIEGQVPTMIEPHTRQIDIKNPFE